MRPGSKKVATRSEPSLLPGEVAEPARRLIPFGLETMVVVPAAELSLPLPTVPFALLPGSELAEPPPEPPHATATAKFALINMS